MYEMKYVTRIQYHPYLILHVQALRSNKRFLTPDSYYIIVWAVGGVAILLTRLWAKYFNVSEDAASTHQLVQKWE